MDLSVTARFVHTGYHLEAVEGEHSLESLLTGTFPRGAVIEVTIKAKTTGERRGACTERTKYGTCNTILNADGTCSDASRHVTEELSEADAA